MPAQLVSMSPILDPISNAPVHVKTNQGKYVGEHINAANLQ